MAATTSWLSAQSLFVHLRDFGFVARQAQSLVTHYYPTTDRNHSLTPESSPVKLVSRTKRERARQLIMLDKPEGSRTSRVASIAMLCLLAHAFFVSVTHHHSSHQNLAANGAASVSTDNSGGSGPTRGSASDAHCLSCRLQRNFTSNVHPASVLVQPLHEPLSRQTTLTAPCSPGSCFIFSNRAPPTIDYQA